MIMPIWLRATPFAALIAGSTILGTFAGYFIDRIFGVAFITTVILTFCGFALGILGAVKIINTIYYGGGQSD